MRPEPQYREPTMGRSQSFSAEREPDMLDMHKAISDITEASHRDMAAPMQPHPQPEPHRVGSLINRLVNRGRQAVASAPVQRAPEPAAPPAPRMEARREAPRSGEDLDIPAFLRRQAN